MNIARPSALLFLTCALNTVLPQITPAAWGQSPGGDPQTTFRHSEKPSAPTLASSSSKLPLSFEANQGQTDPQVRFLSRGQGYSLFLTNSAAVLALSRPNPSPNNSANALAEKSHASKPFQSDVVRMELSGSNPTAHVAGADQLPGIANYFLGKDPSSWHTNVPTYAKVQYSGVYPGVDLVYYGNQHQLEYDFLVTPHANPKQVRLHFAGAKRLSLKPDGDLTVTARHGEVAFHKPAVYQTINGQRHAVEGRFTLLARNKVGFQLGNYDHTQELVIDPILAYSTYLGGSGIFIPQTGMVYGDSASAIAVDSSGDVYVAGTAYSVDFPVTSGAFQTNPGQSNSFITKLNPSGSALVYSTYFGSGGSIAGIAVDSAGSAHVAGSAAAGLPVTKGAFQTIPSNPNGLNGFVTKLSPSGSELVYSTYLGGSGGSEFGDLANGIAVDKSGSAYVTGLAASADFPVTKGAFQTALQGTNGNAFITKLNAGGTALIYSTYLGGDDNFSELKPPDQASGIAVDGDGNAYVAGRTASTNFPVTAGAFQPANRAPSDLSYNAFFTEINSSGSALVYSTYLGGSDQGFDKANAVAIDGSGFAYITGVAFSSDFPVTAGAYQTVNKKAPIYHGELGTAFVAKFDPSHSKLVYSTYLGGSVSFNPASGGDAAYGIAAESSGNAYVTGSTTSTDFPVTSDAFQAINYGYSGTTFLTKLNSSGSAILYSTYLGGEVAATPFGPDAGKAVALDSSSNAYVAGVTYSAMFPTTSGSFQRENKAVLIATTNAFVSKFGFSLPGTSLDLISSETGASYPGQLVGFLAAVSSIDLSGNPPTGNVVFSVDGVAQATLPLLHDGHAVYYNRSLAPGNHQVTAAYQGNAESGPSNQSLTQTILNEPAPPEILPPSGTYRAVQAVISTVTPNAAIFYTTDGTVPTTSSYQYTGPIPIFISGVIRAIAFANGVPNPLSAESKYLLQPLAISTSTSLQASATQLASGKPVTFTATVRFASGPTPPGDILFMDGNVAIATVPLQGSQATFTTSALGIGGHSISAFYPGIAANPAIPYPGALVSQSPALVLGVDP